MELRFRPDDNFCKPAFATRRPVVAVILKVKYKKKKNDKEVIVLCEPVGCVKEEYKFCNLCDFQYLPTTKEKCIIDMVVPKGLDLDWLNSDASYFLPPPAFSRMDSVQVKPINCQIMIFKFLINFLKIRHFFFPL